MMVVVQWVSGMELLQFVQVAMHVCMQLKVISPSVMTLSPVNDVVFH